MLRVFLQSSRHSKNFRPRSRLAKWTGINSFCWSFLSLPSLHIDPISSCFPPHLIIITLGLSLWGARSAPSKRCPLSHETEFYWFVRNGRSTSSLVHLHFEDSATVSLVCSSQAFQYFKILFGSPLIQFYPTSLSVFLSIVDWSELNFEFVVSTHRWDAAEEYISSKALVGETKRAFSVISFIITFSRP